MPDRLLHSPVEWFRWIGRNAKRIAVFVAGVVVVAAGVAMLVLPGPGLVVIILGLGILATEFVWAERALDKAKAKAKSAAASARSMISR
ncbi:MAG: PGPGW domain-containing protein [Acidobacteria bacterium]|nr:PGPGW domain-containing protein [Acidobacteriota bacterium]